MREMKVCDHSPLVNLIVKVEGSLTPGTLSHFLNNPGSLTWAKQATAIPYLAPSGVTWARFLSPLDGYRALERQVKLDISRNLQIAKYAAKTAGPVDGPRFLEVLRKTFSVTPEQRLGDIFCSTRALPKTPPIEKGIVGSPLLLPHLIAFCLILQILQKLKRLLSGSKKSGRVGNDGESINLKGYTTQVRGGTSQTQTQGRTVGIPSQEGFGGPSSRT